MGLTLKKEIKRNKNARSGEGKQALVPPMERSAGEEVGRGVACEEGGGAGQQEGGVPMGTICCLRCRPGGRRSDGWEEGRW